jgi:hypothetical protein
MGTPKPKPTGPLTDDQIKGALQHSGFPLEIRLLQAFHEAGFDPVIGHRFIPGDGEKSAEVDVMAYAGAPLANHKGSVHLKAMIEAKQLPERKVFVGLKWKQPVPHEMRSMRIRFSGRPTCRVLCEGPNGQELVQIMLGPPGPIAEALDPLNEPIVCHHWCYVQDDSKFEFVAEQDDRHLDSFSKLIRVVTWLEEDTAAVFARRPSGELLRVQILSPTIVLGTPHLYIYDPLQPETLEKASSIILHQMHEAGGKVHGRYVDVVTEDGLPEFIDRYRRAAARLQVACDKHIGALLEITEKQRLSQIEIDAHDEQVRALRSFAGTASSEPGRRRSWGER